MTERKWWLFAGVVVVFMWIYAFALPPINSQKPAIPDDNPHIALDLTTLRVPVAEAAGLPCATFTTLHYFDSWQVGTSGPYQNRKECDDARSWRERLVIPDTDASGGLIKDKTTLCRSVNYCYKP